jgi:hypothetical protein
MEVGSISHFGMRMLLCPCLLLIGCLSVYDDAPGSENQTPNSPLNPKAISTATPLIFNVLSRYFL